MLSPNHCCVIHVVQDLASVKEKHSWQNVYFLIFTLPGIASLGIMIVACFIYLLIPSVSKITKTLRGG